MIVIMKNKEMSAEAKLEVLEYAIECMVYQIRNDNIIIPSLPFESNLNLLVKSVITEKKTQRDLLEEINSKL